MRKLFQYGVVCTLLLGFDTPSFAWGAFSDWATGSEPQNVRVCSVQRPRGIWRHGQASVFYFQNGAQLLAFGVVDNTTSPILARRGFGNIDLWLQTINARSLTVGPLQFGPETQGFGVMPGYSISVMIETVLPIGPMAARCAAQ